MSNKTALYDAHVKLEATMVDFGGFMMPMRYKKTSIIDEHLQVRNKVGMFDTSHMGRFWVTGVDSLQFLDMLVPRDLSKLSNNHAGYSFMLNENGGFRDDVIITRFSANEFMIVCNAGNLDKIWSWVTTFVYVWNNAGKKVEIKNKSNSSCMIAVQGPMAISILENLSETELPEKRFSVKWIEIQGQKILFSTTGYTGASGGELILFDSIGTIKEKASKLWNILLENDIMPCALGSRDTLRMEAGYRLYGNDIDENIHLLESGLDFAPFAHIDKNSGYIGQQAVLSKKDKIETCFVGFKLVDKGIPRHGYKILSDGIEIGVVLSGTKSPLTKDSFGMAIVNKSHKELGSRFIIDIRGKMKEAEVIILPIYDQSIYGINIRK